jgi:hypothetical protein
MSLTPASIAIADQAELERRAGALARGGAAEDAAPTGSVSVTFRLGGARCAIEASTVDRAVLRLGAVFVVPLASGGERAATFVDERPLPVIDLLRPARGLEGLRGAPALVVALEAGPVALAVEGPLDLSDAAVEAAAEPSPLDGDDPPLVGRLSDGAALLDPRWLRRFAARAFAP